MLFNTDIFLFIFLPVTFALFYGFSAFFGRRAGIVVLLLASLLFYAWWNPPFLLLLLASIAGNYVLAGFISNTKSPARRLALVVAALALNLGVLGYFKYANFFIENINAVLGPQLPAWQIILPLGISFFTFQQIAYVLDTYWGRRADRDPVSYALFVTFFPHLIAGPLVHHDEMMSQFVRRQAGRINPRDIAVGLSILVIGLAKKVVIADSVAPFATTIFAQADLGEPLTMGDAWFGVLAYTAQIYFDFSGYSDMAIGLARLFGIKLPLNFASPYKARSIIDFWRRWHITLSRFLRDYLYIPLGGNRTGPNRRYVNLMIVMLLGGLWHGAAWTFVIWGGLHGFYLVVNHLWNAYVAPRLESSGFIAHVVQLLSPALTFLAVVVAWVFFRAESLDGATSLLAAMAGLSDTTIAAAGSDFEGLTVADRSVILFALAIAFLAPNTQQIMALERPALGARLSRIQQAPRALLWRPTLATSLAFGVLAAITILRLWTPTEFLYFNF